MRHPESAIRLASITHRPGTPKITKDSPESNISFAKSFRTVSSHPTTLATICKADENRQSLAAALDSSLVSGERIVETSKRYLPLIHQILLSCKVQPEKARLDVPLEFSWTSGLETNKYNKHNKGEISYSSNVIMYDLVMTVVSEGLGHAVSATEAAANNNGMQDYVKASREYKAAAATFHSLAQHHLPEWTAKCPSNNTSDDTLPVECSIPAAEALAQIYRTNAQQMAIATVLTKPDQPNYGLLAKLSWGVADEMEKCVNRLRAKQSGEIASRMDAGIFDFVNFQIGFQKSLSMYFQARNQWNTKGEHGIAIALLKRSWQELKAVKQLRTAVGKAHIPDIADFQKHIEQLLALYEGENNTIYFSTVPNTAMVLQQFEEGVLMGKMEDYIMETVDPLPLILPEPEVAVPKKSLGGLFSRISKLASQRI